MTKVRLIDRAKELHRALGGSIFAFPIDIEDQFSKYAVVIYLEGKYFVYPEATDISEATVGIATILKELTKAGYNLNFERDVRFLIGEKQLNAPDVRMRRLKKGMIIQKNTP